MRRGKNQVLFSYLPGKPVDYDNAIAVIKRWISLPVQDINKRKIIGEVYRSVRAFSKTRGFPKVAAADYFEFLTPLSVEAEIFPLTFTCDGCSHAFSFKTVQQLNRTLKRHKCLSCGGNLIQMDLVYVHECGHLWAPSVAPCKQHGFDKMVFDKQGSNSPKDWVWRCETCKVEISLNNWCPNCKEIVYPAPFRKTNIFMPQSLTLVNLQEIDEKKLSEDDFYRKLVLAKYLNLFEKYGCNMQDCLSASSQDDTKLQAIIADLKAKNMPDDLIQQVLQSMNKFNPDVKTARDNILQEVSRLIDPPRGEVLTVASRASEFMETLDKCCAVHLDKMVEMARRNQNPQFQQIENFPKILKSIGVQNAYVLGDLSLLKVVYGFTRGSTESPKQELNRFAADRAMDQSKVPIYLNKSNTEAIILEFDRWKILAWLKAKGIVTEIPDRKDEAGLKAWFLNNIDEEAINSFSEIDEEATFTREIYKLLHSMSHSLLATASVECGLDKNSLAELIMPSIPAIIIYCSNIQEVRVGGMFTLFENNIHSWIHKAVDRARNCIYDPVCMDHQSACHACIHLSEISCCHFNHDLGRDVLAGKTTQLVKTVGFWADEFMRTIDEHPDAV